MAEKTEQTVIVGSFSKVVNGNKETFIQVVDHEVKLTISPAEAKRLIQDLQIILIND